MANGDGRTCHLICSCPLNADRVGSSDPRRVGARNKLLLDSRELDDVDSRDGLISTIHVDFVEGEKLHYPNTPILEVLSFGQESCTEK